MMSPEIKVVSCIITLMVFISTGCSEPQKSSIPNNQQAMDHIKKAADRVAANNADEALEFLTKALEFGYEKPMKIVSDERFVPLIRNPETRPAIRNLLKKFAKESFAVMVTSDEEGERIKVFGQLIDTQDSTIVTNASIDLAHADAMGKYSDESSGYNPRIFAYLRPNKMGRFEIRTILPGAYTDKNEEVLLTRHIHFDIVAPGYEPYSSEFILEAQDGAYRTIDHQSTALVAERVQKLKEEHVYRVIIPLQRK